MGTGFGTSRDLSHSGASVERLNGALRASTVDQDARSSRSSRQVTFVVLDADDPAGDRVDRADLRAAGGTTPGQIVTIGLAETQRGPVVHYFGIAAVYLRGAGVFAAWAGLRFGMI
jgi:hypothetical protein